MSSRLSLGNLLLTTATVAATLVTVAVAAAKLRESSALPGGTEDLQALTIDDWRQYGTEGVRMGPASAAVTIVEFADFQCPYCGLAATTLRELRSRHPEDVALVYRHYPLNEISLKAAWAAECGNRVGLFEPIHDHLFAQQDSFGTMSWIQLAWESGISDTLQFAVCMQDSTVLSTVGRDVRAGNRLGVNATPTLLVNDQLFIGNPGLDYLDSFVKETVSNN